MIPPAARKYLSDHRAEHLEALKAFLRFPSIANVTGGDDACEPCARWLGDYLTAIGLQADLMDTGSRPIVLARGGPGPAAPTVLIYGHYDVQPADPLELWKSDPFEPVVADGHLYARGANDNKGQLFANLMGIEALLATGELGVNVIVMVEGQEEIGSPDLEPWVEAHKELLAADAAFLSDSSWFAPGVPSITYALRGLVYAEVEVRGPSRDLHSGEYGGAVTNPVNALARIVAAMHDARGRVTLPGFYDDVLPLSDSERNAWEALGFDESATAAAAGVSDGTLGGGERDLPALERLWARPTLDCNGMGGGYTGAGAKTIIPARAAAKISMRLVARQDPQKIQKALSEFVSANTPAGVSATVTFHAASRPVLIDPNCPTMTAGRAAMSEAFGGEAALIRCGASVPVTELFQRLLGLDAILMGYGLPDDNLHSPNEKFSLEQLYGGSLASAAMLGNLSGG